MGKSGRSRKGKKRVKGRMNSALLENERKAGVAGDANERK